MWSALEHGKSILLREFRLKGPAKHNDMIAVLMVAVVGHDEMRRYSFSAAKRLLPVGAKTTRSDVSLSLKIPLRKRNHR